MDQNQWYHFGVGAPPILVYFSGVWDVHWGYGILTHGQLSTSLPGRQLAIPLTAAAGLLLGPKTRGPISECHVGFLDIYLGIARVTGVLVAS